MTKAKFPRIIADMLWEGYEILDIDRAARAVTVARLEASTQAHMIERHWQGAPKATCEKSPTGAHYTLYDGDGYIGYCRYCGQARGQPPEKKWQWRNLL